ncbi:MAG: DUF6455 family protein [Tabrizicola sp.]|uniref:DUF6455 family protein n=1 Tax=Tabrizicola sp. TaxID=2005166 RepID=UPI002736319F|nr:DUF6455 family protein [Tabrizicola sp.]MDP3264329.1 DUF6455 family protein [Tabrizicola sp.]MDP3648626.1 DUF6455 family protein [Paracoccaceae bacterium]MDZ4068911.1 DUF6455 family protein [Tabrizicola sp.]
MIGYPETPRAWWLTRGMARLSGVDLSQAVVEGWLRRSELARIIDRCAACTEGDACDRWLATSGRANQMPEFCPNKPEIESLRG